MEAQVSPIDSQLFYELNATFDRLNVQSISRAKTIALLHDQGMNTIGKLHNNSKITRLAENGKYFEGLCHAVTLIEMGGTAQKIESRFDAHRMTTSVSMIMSAGTIIGMRNKQSATARALMNFVEEYKEALNTILHSNSTKS